MPGGAAIKVLPSPSFEKNKRSQEAQWKHETGFSVISIIFFFVFVLFFFCMDKITDHTFNDLDTDL